MTAEASSSSTAVAVPAAPAAEAVAKPTAPLLPDGHTIATAESVMEGQLDKLCDKIADVIVDACVKQDPTARIAVQACIKSKMAILYGEVVTKGTLDYDDLVRQVVQEAGYNSEDKLGLDFRTMNVIVAVSESTPDLAQAVAMYSSKESLSVGSSDMGVGLGYASAEGGKLFNYMPCGTYLTNKCAQQLSMARKKTPWMRPDGRVQVTVEYASIGSVGSAGRKPVRIQRLAINVGSTDPSISVDRMEKDLRTLVVEPILGRLPGYDAPMEVEGEEAIPEKTIFSPLVDDRTIFQLNRVTPLPTKKKSGKEEDKKDALTLAGEAKDAALDIHQLHATGAAAAAHAKSLLGAVSDDSLASGASGSKPHIDAYGAACGIGGSLSGKSPDRAVRFSTYAARWVAKSLVAAGLALECQVQLAFAGGYSEPLSVTVNTFGTGKVDDNTLVKLVYENFDLRVGCLIYEMGMRNPELKFQNFAAFGHMGRDDVEACGWEKAKELTAMD